MQKQISIYIAQLIPVSFEMLLFSLPNFMVTKLFFLQWATEQQHLSGVLCNISVG